MQKEGFPYLVEWRKLVALSLYFALAFYHNRNQHRRRHHFVRSINETCAKLAIQSELTGACSNRAQFSSIQFGELAFE